MLFYETVILYDYQTDFLYDSQTDFLYDSQTDFLYDSHLNYMNRSIEGRLNTEKQSKFLSYHRSSSFVTLKYYTNVFTLS